MNGVFLHEVHATKNPLVRPRKLGDFCHVAMPTYLFLSLLIQLRNQVLMRSAITVVAMPRTRVMNGLFCMKVHLPSALAGRPCVSW